jgi:hypothetical protein
MPSTATLIARRTDPRNDADRRRWPAPPPIRDAAQRLMRAIGADVACLAIREPRTNSAVVRCAEGVRSTSVIGLTIEPAVGLGGASLRSGAAAITERPACDRRLTPDEAAFAARERLNQMIVVALRSGGFRGDPHFEGIAYAGRMDREHPQARAARRRPDRPGRPRLPARGGRHAPLATCVDAPHRSR